MHADRQAVGDIPEAAPTLAANPLVGVRGQDILAAAAMLLTQIARSPAIAMQQYLLLLGELGRIAHADRGDVA